MTATFKHLRKVEFSITAISLLFFLSVNSYAQSRPFSLVYSDNIKGSSTIFGNTLLQIIDNGSVNTIKMNDNSANGNSIYGNNKENMQYADVDGNTGTGSVTRNSSTADLLLPAGINTIKLARIYWGGRVKNSEFPLSALANKKIKIRKGTANAYSDIVAAEIDTTSVNASYTQYQAYADITTLVQNNGVGTYEVGNVALSTGIVPDGGACGGWSIAVVYENNNLAYNSIRLYDGFGDVYNGGNSQLTTVTLTGLDVPSGTLISGDATMGVVTWEGDAHIKKDFLKINGHLFSNVTNQIDNPWNGTITNNGVHVTTKNPNYTNQMGIDIDQFDVGTGFGIAPNASMVTLQFGTESDRYFPGLFTFTIKVKDPSITLDKSVTDANNNHLGEKNEVLTYTLKGRNSGVGNANSIIVTDTLPSSVTYVPNSLKVISSPGVTAGSQTDAAGDDNAEYIVNGLIKTVQFRLGTGSNGTSGGTLAANDSFQVEFKVTVNDPGSGVPVPSIINIARIKAKSDANADFIDDATAIINEEGGPMPVTLVSFSGTLLQSNNVKLAWSTSMEINCSEYKIERSPDGKTFSEVSTVAGNGTTSSLHAYSITDNVSSTPGAVVYYRLKQMDIDKKASYSKVIAVKLKTLNKLIDISPNPFTSYLNINMESNSNEVIIVKVISTQGKEVISKNIQVSKGFNYISIDKLSRLAAGNYFIQFISSAEKITRKITKQ